MSFPFSFADARFIGNPIDFVVFERYTHGKDENGDSINVVLVNAIKGKEDLWRTNGEIPGMRWIAELPTICHRRDFPFF
jgi:hypothetical protein